MITSYAVADAMGVPLTGWFAYRFGTMRWFLYSIVGFGLFSLLCGVAQTLDARVLFRILQRLSGGPLMPLLQILLLRIFAREKAGIALIIWELTDANPIVNLRIFRFREIIFGTIGRPLGFGAFFAQAMLTPVWPPQVAGYTATETGRVFA